MASDKTIVVNGDLAAVIRCQRCGGNVYEAEKMLTSIGCYHPGCFKCAKCSRSLDQSSCNVGQDEKDIYCTKCYQEDFANFSKRCRSRWDCVTLANNLRDRLTGSENAESVL